jgi:hypothetical protein
MTKVTSVSWLKTQLYGTIAITTIIAVVVGALELYKTVAPSFINGNTNVINLESGGRTGVFVVWLVFVLIFSVVNIIIYITKHLKQSKQS